MTVKPADILAMIAITFGTASLPGTGWGQPRSVDLPIRSNLTAEDLRAMLQELLLANIRDGDGRLLMLSPSNGTPLAGGPVSLAKARLLRDPDGPMQSLPSQQVSSMVESCFAASALAISGGSALPAEDPKAPARPAAAIPAAALFGGANLRAGDDRALRDSLAPAPRGGPKPNAGKDAAAPGEDLGSFLAKQIAALNEAAQTPRGGQVPDPSGGRGDLVFVVLRAVPDSAGAPPAAGAAGSDLEFWRSILGGGGRPDYETYLWQLPRGTLTGLARPQSASLLAESTPRLPASVTPAKPEIALEPIEGEYVATEAVRVREGPDAKAKMIVVLAEGQAVWVLGKAIGRNWYLVWLNGGALGYVSAAFLEDAVSWQLRRDGAAKRPVPVAEMPYLEIERPQLAPIPMPALPVSQPFRPMKPVMDVYSILPTPGASFKDCDVCPEMVVVPTGAFTMAPSNTEHDWSLAMGAKREWLERERNGPHVAIARPFAVAKHEVTRGQYAAFAQNTNRGDGDGCNVLDREGWKKDIAKNWRDPGFSQADNHPVTCVNWDDAKAYAAWLSRWSGKAYRLPSEAEWEYAARGGTTTMRPWGDDAQNVLGCGYANVSDQARAAAHRLKRDPINMFMCQDGYVHTAPVGSFKANGFGLHDMFGNLWEWTEDCWHDNYAGSPGNGNAWTKSGDCNRRVVRGGSWSNSPRNVRAAARSKSDIWSRSSVAGFRVARTD